MIADLSGLQNEMLEAGYQIVTCVQGWTIGCEFAALDVAPKGPGVWRPKDDLSVMVFADRIRVYRSEFFGEACTKRSFYDTVTVGMFDSVAGFLDWCRENGEQTPYRPYVDQGVAD